jgi:phage baseplate assembly protein W
MGYEQDFLGRGIAYPFRFSRQTGRTRVSTTESADKEHIRESIQQILGTHRGERFMRPDFGSDLRRVVFEPNLAVARGLLRHYVYDAIRRWEPRVELLGLEFEDPRIDAGRHLLPVRIAYRIIRSQVEDNLVYPFYREENG